MSHLFFFFKQKTAYEMPISDWSSDVCSSDLADALGLGDEQWSLSYQSRFGAEHWLSPATDASLDALAGRGVRRVDVIAPGFARSEERRVGKECVSTCRSRWSPYP